MTLVILVILPKHYAQLFPRNFANCKKYLTFVVGKGCFSIFGGGLTLWSPLPQRRKKRKETRKDTEKMAKQQVVQSLAEKVARVIEENNRLEQQQAEMTANLQKLRVENRTLKEKLDEVQKKLSLLELGEGLASKDADSASRKRARAQINRLMREIDRCIALMNK